MTAWTLDIRGLPLRVWELGTQPADRASPPVVCLHGFLDQGFVFAAVAQGRPGRWLAPDQRGFGASGHLPPAAWYHFSDLVADVDALVAQLAAEGHSRVDLVGHSMGGTVAALFAAARPDRVRRLVLVDGLGAPELGNDDPVDRMVAFLEGVGAEHRASAPQPADAAVRRLLRRCPGLERDRAEALVAAGTQATPDGGRRWTHDPRHRIRSPTTFREVELLAFLRRIQAPTLLVWPENSLYTAEVQQRRGAALASARSQTLPGGHLVPLEQPKALGDAITAFLAEVEGE